MFELKKCKSKKAIEVDPTEKLKLDLEALKQEFELVLDAGIVLAIKVEGVEVLVHEYGKLVFNTLRDEDKIRKISEKIYEHRK